MVSLKTHVCLNMTPAKLMKFVNLSKHISYSVQ